MEREVGMGSCEGEEGGREGCRDGSRERTTYNMHIVHVSSLALQCLHVHNVHVYV